MHRLKQPSPRETRSGAPTTPKSGSASRSSGSDCARAARSPRAHARARASSYGPATARSPSACPALPSHRARRVQRIRHSLVSTPNFESAIGGVVEVSDGRAVVHTLQSHVDDHHEKSQIQALFFTVPSFRFIPVLVRSACSAIRSAQLGLVSSAMDVRRCGLQQSETRMRRLNNVTHLVGEVQIARSSDRETTLERPPQVASAYLASSPTCSLLAGRTGSERPRER
ncbi:hypothetical protein EXIGLDRAFT_360348 [Exidia glandulosa HHB12029]|uniref:Uncharacterized protein n=1 Tax=Exidia glandulosa HHB12029 TaxID=1314781 RepID=A0A165C6J3_EXIGL|nr:hypothetical protein EXIGLDRAFT_360348 [Exidia glandulosa HHB12029]